MTGPSLWVKHQHPAVASKGKVSPGSMGKDPLVLGSQTQEDARGGVVGRGAPQCLPGSGHSVGEPQGPVLRILSL